MSVDMVVANNKRYGSCIRYLGFLGPECSMVRDPSVEPCWRTALSGVVGTELPISPLPPPGHWTSERPVQAAMSYKSPAVLTKTISLQSLYAG